MAEEIGKNRIAVIDTETNWNDEVMSIGVVIADSSTYLPLDQKYYIFTPEYMVGGIFSDRLFLRDDYKTKMCGRKEAMADIREFLDSGLVKKIFAYNGRFDKGHLPEIADYDWHDIMMVAAYRQFNKAIPYYADCYKTGRMKNHYGVESMIRMITGITDYSETHNGLIDALDELQIMRLLELPPDIYDDNARI